MRNLFKTLAALVAAAAAMTACQTAPVETVETNRLIKVVEFTAEDIETRTSFTEPEGNSYPVIWGEDDEVVIFPNDQALRQTATVDRSDDGRTAKFHAAFALEAAPSYQFFLVSPASALDDSGSGNTVNVTVPADQFPSATSPDEAAQILFAVSKSFDTVPDAVNFNPRHLTAYIKLSLINVDPGLGEIGYVRIASTELIAGKAALQMSPLGLTRTEETATNAITAYVNSPTDVWFACLPSDYIGGTVLTVTVSGSKGSLVREINIPAEYNLAPGDIAIFTVDMKSAIAPEKDQVFSRISEARFVTEGTRFVMATAADNLSYGLSATQGDGFRLGVPVTKSRPGTKAGEAVETIVNPSDDVEILTVEAGTKDGVYAFKTKAGKYLAVDASKSSALLSIDSKTTMSDWRIKYKDGACSFECVTPSYTYGMRYRKNDNKFLAFRPSFVAANEPIALYKLEGTGGSDWKMDPDLHLSKTSLTLTEGDTQRLAVALCYSLSDGGVVTFRSEDPSVATVSDKGDVTAVNTGETYIWAHVGETENYQADSVSCKVTVLPPVPATGVSISPTSLVMIEGDQARLTASVMPDNAGNKAVSFESSDPSVVQVLDNKGNIKALKAGTSNVTVTTDDGGFQAVCAVTVKTPPVSLAPVDLGLSVKWANKNIGAERPEEVGDYFAWGETTTKERFDWSNYAWGHSQSALTRYVWDPSYGIVDNRHVLLPSDDAATANLGGKWRLPTEKEIQELFECSFVKKGKGYEVTGKNGQKIFLPMGNFKIGSDLADGYSSFAEYWAKELRLDYNNSYGRAFYFNNTAHSIGSPERRAGLPVRAVDGSNDVAVSSISIPSSLSLILGNTATLTATVTPSNATIPDVVWSSSNTSVATVDYQGVVKGVSSGTATITASSYDGTKTATCTVTVGKTPVLKLQYSKSALETATWTDYTGPIQLSATNQEYFFRLYDTANGTIVKTGTFSRYNTSYPTYASFTAEVYANYLWRLVLKTECYLEETLICKDEAHGIDFQDCVAVYYPRPLALSLDSDLNSVFSSGGTVSVKQGSTRTLYVRHKNSSREEYLYPTEYLSITGGDTSIATITLDSNTHAFLYVTAKKAGSTTFRIKYNYLGMTLDNYVTIKVTGPVTKVTIDQRNNATYYYDDQFNIDKGDSMQMSATVEGGAGEGVTWSLVTSADAISVNSTTGKITGVKYGTAYLQATSVEDPSKHDLITVYVWEPATEIRFGQSIRVKPGDTQKMYYVVEPSLYANQRIKFETPGYYAPKVNQWSIGKVVTESSGWRTIALTPPSDEPYHAGNLNYGSSSQYATYVTTMNGKLRKEVPLAVVQFYKTDTKPMDYVVLKKDNTHALRSMDGGLRIVQDKYNRALIDDTSINISTSEEVVAVIHKLNGEYSYGSSYTVVNGKLTNATNVHGVAVAITDTGKKVRWSKDSDDVPNASDWPSGQPKYPSCVVTSANSSQQNGLPLSASAFYYNVKRGDSHDIQPEKQIEAYQESHTVYSFVHPKLMGATDPTVPGWFVPTIAEWRDLKSNSAEVHSGILANITKAGGSFPNTRDYWLIECYDKDYAWYASYLSGAYHDKKKNAEDCYVRPFIRF